METNVFFHYEDSPFSRRVSCASVYRPMCLCGNPYNQQICGALAQMQCASRYKRYAIRQLFAIDVLREIPLFKGLYSNNHTKYHNLKGYVQMISI